MSIFKSCFTNNYPEISVAESELYQMVKTKGIPKEWLDALAMQLSVPHEEKGWIVKVYWKKSIIARFGVFAGEDLEAGTVLRRLVFGQNLMKINSKADFPPGPWSKEWLQHHATVIDEDGDIVCFLPGSTMNHSDKENCAYRKTAVGYDCFLTRSVKRGEELVSDYSVLPTLPLWYKKEMDLKYVGDFLESKNKL